MVNEDTNDFWLEIEREIEEELEACRNCAYNDCGSCSCYEKKSICCPYADDEEEGVLLIAAALKMKKQGNMNIINF